MRTFGILLFGAGLVGFIISFQLDITVPVYLTKSDSIVFNVGKISDREAGLIASAMACLVGAIFIAAAALVARLEEISAHGLAIRSKLTKENEQTYRAVKDTLS